MPLRTPAGAPPGPGLPLRDYINAKTGGPLLPMKANRIKQRQESLLSGGPETMADHGLPARRLLVLDDDPAVRHTIALMAKRMGAAVQVCSTLAEFEAMIVSFAPDLLLIDLMMPDVDGIEVIARVGPHCQAAIYVMTGADKRTFEASRGVLSASRTQIAGFLHKPFSAADLQQVLERESIDLPDPSAVLHRAGPADLLSPGEFEEAAKSGQIGPFFQPIIYSEGGRLKGFEALLRITGQSNGFFAPQYLEQLVRDDDLSTFVTDIVIDKSLGFLAGLASAPELSISINIFGVHAVADGFRERLVERCTHYAIAPSRVILELSEAALFEFDEQDFRKITQLRLAGFGLSIDDFGTGNSSLGRLASLPFSELKIDKSFCLALPGSESAEAVIEACLGIARKLDMTVTAEGIETGEIAARLAAMGCHALQGHYFGQAMPADEAAQWIREVGSGSAA
jgi:EAL domain-containing protein (putative c-di-GMP-specific phosphodiesterase class I)/CheY-like chemotaxis protein